MKRVLENDEGFRNRNSELEVSFVVLSYARWNTRHITNYL